MIKKIVTTIKKADILETLAYVIFFSAIILAMYMTFLHMYEDSILSHEPYDSYTRQALAWRDGKTYLEDGKDLTWLELVEYKGKYYVSFPPVPSLFILPFTYHYGLETPNSLANWIYAYLAFLVVFTIFRRRCNKKPWLSAIYAFCFVFGCNILSLSFRGWVWYQAQTLGFLLACTAVYFIMGNKRWEHILSYLFWALSVGCRPFHAIYFPYLLYRTYKVICPNGEKINFKLINKLVITMMPAIIIGITMMVYNYFRFDNPLEFGHNYLPAFTEYEYGQFDIHYFAENCKNTVRLPRIENGLLQFDRLEGNNFLIVNPIYILLILAMIKYRKNKEAWFLFGLIVVNALLLLVHKSMGALQFGLRYFIDMIPWMLILLLLNREFKEKVHTILIGLFGVSINVYGTWWFWIYYLEVTAVG
jgi:hypothetical protein